MVLSSNLTILAVGFPFTRGLCPFSHGAFTGQVLHDACMHACMNGNGPPSESQAIQPTLKLSEIVELASVPVPKCLLRTKYDNRSRHIPWDVHGSLRLVEPRRLRGSVSYDGATRSLAGHGKGQERPIYGTLTARV